MILSKSQLVNNINSDISDQSYGQISPYDIRHNLLDIIDSVHNLTFSQELKSLNLATFPSGNTKLGQLTLENINLDGYNSQDNTAIGYSVLKSNYQGIRNTAVGSYSLSCNIYGEGNVALGYNALAGNTVGNLNIGLGSYTLHNNKSGNGNVAIGHGAGYYIGKNTSNKLFIAHHAVDGDYICNNPNGTGLTPLLQGDFSSLQLGVGVKTLHAFGALQVGGDLTPSGNNVLNIGHQLYNWKSLYLSSSLNFANNSSISAYSPTGILVSGSLFVPINNHYELGSSTNKWKRGYFQNLTVDGTANIGTVTYNDTQVYNGIKIYLATDSNLQPQYSDANLLGGGLFIKSSDNREYSLSYFPPSSGMPCFTDSYDKSTFRSNISFQVPSSSYIKTNSIISYSSDAFNDSDCYGLFFNSGITYISRKNVLNVNPGLPNGHIAGIGNVNFISNSGEVQNYSVSISSLESGVSVSQRFLSGTKSRQKDVVTNKDKLSGFELKYINDTNNNDLDDRLVIGSYNKTPNFVNGMILMKESTGGSVMSITNIPEVTENVLPNTIFNVRSKNDCIARFTSENNAYYKSAIQLLGSANCEASGLEISYLNNSGVADVTVYRDSNPINFIRMKDTKEIGILSSGIINATITIGNSGTAKLPVISIKDNLWVGNSIVAPSVGYGKLYNFRAEKGFADQYNSLYFMDGSGNSTDLVVNKLDNVDARAIYTDGSGNTFAGYLSPSGRKTITGAAKNNISYGYKALYSISSGSGNLAIGYSPLYDLVLGNNNIVIGDSSASGLVNTSSNIIIGNQSFNKTSDLANTSGNIVIGHNIGASNSGSHNFLVGNNGLVLLDGKLGPTNSDKRLTLPSGGRLYINNANDTDSLCLKSNVIEIIDSGGNNYPDNTLTFRFIGNNSADLLILSHDSLGPSDYIATWGYPKTFNNLNYYNDEYWFPTVGLSGEVTPNAISNKEPKPYSQLNGNFKLKGNIQFGDGTYLGSSKPIIKNTLLANSGIALGNSGISLANSGISRINSAIIEGFMPDGLQAPANASTKTSGILILKDSNWANSGDIFVINRDTTSVIHSGAYVIAARINNEYKPIWISASSTPCTCCNN
jgi:hypothetical protein